MGALKMEQKPTAEQTLSMINGTVPDYVTKAAADALKRGGTLQDALDAQAKAISTPPPEREQGVETGPTDAEQVQAVQLRLYHCAIARTMGVDSPESLGDDTLLDVTALCAKPFVPFAAWVARRMPQE